MMKAELIAPCGMNCRLCASFQKVKNPCPGCFGKPDEKPTHWHDCAIEHCEGRNGPRCSSCKGAVCARLQALDHSCRKNYGVSPVENLQTIETKGMDVFLMEQMTQFTCPECGGTLCVHTPACPECGGARDSRQA